MKYFFSFYLLASFTLAAYFGVSILFSENRKYQISRLLAGCCMSSALWSFGFGTLILQTSPKMAYYCRSVGMIGVFFFLIMMQVLICRISGIGEGLRHYFEGFSMLGIVVYFLVIQPDVTVYQLGEIGMTYYFQKGTNNNLYTAYSIVLSVHMLMVILYMIFKSPLKRVKKFGWQFLVVLVIVVAGMVLDTVFPLMGMPAIPGSSMTQFIGLIMACNAVRAINMSRIDINNMSSYIYYSLAMPVLVYDTDFKLQIMNDAGHRFFGQARDVNRETQFSIGELFECNEQEIFSFRGSNNTIDAVCRYNQVYCSLDISSIYDSYKDTIGYIIMVTDLSEHVQVMERLRAAKHEAELANKAKSRFLANMSHEIRTPMNAIVGFSELLLKEPMDQRARDYVQDIKSSSISLLTIINDILDISKIESGKVEIAEAEYQAVSLLDDVGQIIRMQAGEKHLEYHLSVSDDFPSAFCGDEVRIRSVLVNLLNNAVKYTEEGSISLSVSVRQRYGRTAVLEFVVSDTGIGIPEEELGRLFERFSRVDIQHNYNVEGTGLGLSIVKSNVTIMGGQIDVDSTYGQGSVFTVTIPQRVTDERPYKMSLLEALNQSSGADETVLFHDVCALVVDDNPVNLKVACKSLESYGLEVDAVSSGSEAIERCRIKRYPIIFMDQMMLPMDGVEAMKHIRELNTYYAKGGEGKIVVLTANAIIGVREELLEQGFDAYLEKPMNFAAIEKALLTFLPEEKRAGAVNSKQQNQSGKNTVAVQEVSGNQACPEQEGQTVLDEAERSELLKYLGQVDLERGISQCGGTVADYVDILCTLYENGEAQIAELGRLYQIRDDKAYAVLAHALKGGLLNVGAETLGNLARRLELAGKANDWNFVSGNHDNFCQMYHDFLENVRKVLISQHRIEACTEQSADDQWSAWLRQVRDCIEKFDYAGASSAMHKLSVMQLKEADRAEIVLLSKWLDELDDERMITRIDELLSR